MRLADSLHIVGLAVTDRTEVLITDDSAEIVECSLRVLLDLVNRLRDGSRKQRKSHTDPTRKPRALRTCKVNVAVLRLEVKRRTVLNSRKNYFVSSVAVSVKVNARKLEYTRTESFDSRFADLISFRI